MKKRGVILLLVILLAVLPISFSPLIPAQIDEGQKIENSYLWLIDQADGKWTNLDTETNALALLTLGYDDRLATDGRNALLAKQNTREACWSTKASGNCRAKDTAFAVLALNAIGEPTEDETDWLLSREMPFKVGGISWLLQIDSKSSSNCIVAYDSKEYSLKIHEDKTYSWEAGTPSCLSLVDIIDGNVKPGRYWIKISSGCLDKAYSVSCEDPAVISTPYVLGDLYVPSETFFSPTDVAIETVCIREGAVCNYESTMWTTYALQQVGREYTQFLPYLLGEAEGNKHLIPESFLFLLTGKEEHANNLAAKQNRKGYWSEIRGKGKYWDTSIAVLGLIDYSPENITKATSWLLKNQNSDGSFGTTKKIRDTSMVLHAVWPKQSLEE